MELKDLVPPLELCKQIPPGNFDNSALAWFVPADTDFPEYGDPSVINRKRAWAATSETGVYPAPTLEEIMTDLTEFQPAIVAFWLTRAEVQCWGDQIEEVKNAKSTTAALKLWLKMKGME